MILNLAIDISIGVTINVFTDCVDTYIPKNRFSSKKIDCQDLISSIELPSTQYALCEK